MRSLPYDLKTFVRCLLALIGIAIMLKVSAGWGFAIIFPLMISAAVSDKPERLLFVLMLMITATIANPYFFPKSGGFGLMLRVAMMLLSLMMLTQIAGRRSSSTLKPLLLILVYVAYMIIPSAMGWQPLISFMKILLYVSVFLAYYGVTNRLVNHGRADSKKIRSVFLCVASFFIFGSILLIPFPGIGQMGAEEYLKALESGTPLLSLFKGMANHSQMLGPLAATFGTVLFADLVFSVRRKDKLYLALLACVPILIWKTSSRTAMGSLLAGVFFVLFFFMRARGVRIRWKSKVMGVVIGLFALLAIAVIAVPSARTSAMQFALKFGDVQEKGLTMENVTASRAGRWELSLYYFRKSPAFGNGFQVSEDMQRLKVDSLSRLVSAPVEKGTWVVAILEEGGALGMAIFVIFILVVMSHLLSRHAYIGASAFFVMLVVNLGEFTVFSMTAIGGLLWACVFIGVALDVTRMSEQERDRRRAMFSPPPFAGGWNAPRLG